MDTPTIFQNPKSGSIKVSGTCQIVDETGEVTQSVAEPKLCGCGLSKNKPYCDKSHAQYVKLVSSALENARAVARPILPFGTWRARSFEIRLQTLKNRTEAGEKFVGVKYGVGLINSKTEEKVYEGIFGYLTDSMEITSTLNLAEYIKPGAEAEFVFKLSQDLSQEIFLDQVKDYVSHVAAGIEIYDSRYSEGVFIDDAIADNASAGAYAVGQWHESGKVDLSNVTVSIYEHEELKQSVPGSNLGGNPWSAVSRISALIAAAGVILPAGAIIFSGSLTNGLPMNPGRYRVEIEGLGSISIDAQ